MLRAIWEAASSLFTFARVTLFRGDEDLAVSSSVGGATDMPGTMAGGTDNLLLSLPKDILKNYLFWVRICSTLFMSNK